MVTSGEQIAAWLRQHVASGSAGGLIVGLSGGVDSALVARLCQMAMPDSVLGVLLPCHSDPQDEADARASADHFGIPTVRVALDDPYDALTGCFEEARERTPGRRPEATQDDLRVAVPIANVKPRLRMTTLYYLGNALNYLVAGTGNRCELAIGYFTKHGDGGVDLLPIGNLLKSEVRALARELGVPARIIDKPPSAGLWKGQTDEAEIGFTYDDLERFLTGGAEAVAPGIARRIAHLVSATRHKRALPPTFA